MRILFLAENRFPCEILYEEIYFTGAEKTRELDIVKCGIRFVSCVLDSFYNHKEQEKGLYLITHSSNVQKRQQLERISKVLSMGLKV